MMELSGKVAVVTGAASGIGFAIAEECVSEQMKVVLADVEEDALELAGHKLSQKDVAAGAVEVRNPPMAPPA